MRRPERSHFLIRAAAMFLIATAAPLFAQTSAPVPATVPYVPPIKFKAVTREIVVQPDGSTTITSHTEIQVLKESMIAAAAQSAISYNEGTQTLDIESAYTLKADGRKLPVAPSAILTQQAPRNTSSVLYTDIKQKIIIFPNVEVGDTVVYTTVTRSKPEIPGQFVYDTVFPPTLVFDDARTSVVAPESYPLSYDAQHLTVDTTRSAGNVVYTMRYSNTNPVGDDDDPVSRFDRSPRLSISSFKSYDDLANAYASLAESKIAVTPLLQAKADDITSGVRNRREQAKRIYDWVATHIRYVAIEFGVGSIVPHDADSVLANGYGDCKDHAVVFAALLRAKGIQSKLVLINSSNAYSVAKVPTFGAFNHAIAWVPEFKIYADTTARTPPFGFLPRSEYGKPVLHIADKAGALRHTPILAASDSTVRYTATDKLDDVAHVTGTNTTTGSGAFAGVLRGIGLGIQIDDSNKLAGTLLKDRNMPRATGRFVASPTTDTNDNYSISGNYTTPGVWRGVNENRPFPPPDGLRMVTMAGVVLLGPAADEKYKSASAVPCYSGHYIEDYSLEFPAGFRAGPLPSDAKIKSAHFDYFSHWAASAHAMTVHREFTASFSDARCTQDVVQEAQGTLAQIRKDLATKITLPRNQ